MATAPPKKKRKATDPARKEPRKKTAKTKVRKEAATKINMKSTMSGQGGTSGKVDIFPEEPVELSVPKGSEPSEPQIGHPEIVMEAESKQDIPKDSDEVVKTVSHYGTGYFSNPRRLKRFVNNFRLHAYLAKITGFEISLDKLARFLVLTEKWPGLVKFLNENPDYLDLWYNALQVKGSFAKVELPEPENTDEGEIFRLAIQYLNEPQIRDLFVVEEPITSKELFGFSNWYGFRYYK